MFLYSNFFVISFFDYLSIKRKFKFWNFKIFVSWQFSCRVRPSFSCKIKNDPVLTDRGFLTKEKEMLRSFIIAGILGFICILLFSFVGIYASIESIEILAKSNIPVDVANFLGISAYIFISVVMITSAGSTILFYKRFAKKNFFNSKK